MRGRYYYLLVVMLAGLAAAQPPSSGQFSGTETEAEIPLASKATVRFDLYRSYLILVRGSAGQLRNLNLLLDTGSSSTILDERVALRLHLVEKTAVIALINGRVRARTAILPSLEFGPLRRDNFSVLIQDLGFLQKALSVPVDGVIGLDVLGQVSFMVDYPSREIRFGPPPRLSISLPLRVNEGLATVDAELNHAPVHLLVDTGASSLIIFETRLPKSISGLALNAVQRSTNLKGDFERKQVVLQSLRLGETEFGQEPAFVVHDHNDSGRDFDGVMSPAALGITRIAVDIERGALRFLRHRFHGQLRPVDRAHVRPGPVRPAGHPGRVLPGRAPGNPAHRRPEAPEAKGEPLRRDDLPRGPVPRADPGDHRPAGFPHRARGGPLRAHRRRPEPGAGRRARRLDRRGPLHPERGLGRPPRGH